MARYAWIWPGWLPLAAWLAAQLAAWLLPGCLAVCLAGWAAWLPGCRDGCLAGGLTGFQFVWEALLRCVLAEYDGMAAGRRTYIQVPLKA